jgi:hypothetical protein
MQLNFTFSQELLNITISMEYIGGEFRLGKKKFQFEISEKKG